MTSPYRLARQLVVPATVILPLVALCTGCGTARDGALFHLDGAGALIVGHFTIPPRYQHLVLQWNLHCSGPSTHEGFGLKMEAFHGGDPARNRHARLVLSQGYVVPGSVNSAGVTGHTRIAIKRAGYVVLSVGAASAGTTYYDLNTRCAFSIAATGDAR